MGVGQFRLQRIAILNGITLEVKSALILPKVRKFWARAEGYSVPQTAESYYLPDSVQKFGPVLARP